MSSTHSPWCQLMVSALPRRGLDPGTSFRDAGELQGVKCLLGDAGADARSGNTGNEVS